MRNRTRDTVLGQAIELADTSAKRRTGLLKHDRLEQGAGLWIVPCESVHTFFMKFAIDLVYVDRENRVRKVRNAVPPWRLSACLRANSIIELPAGTAERTGTQAGDELEFEKLGACGGIGVVRGTPEEEEALERQPWPPGAGRVSGPSRFWRCPGCRGILQKNDPLPGLSRYDSVIGSVTCGACGHAVPHDRVYGGVYDVAEVQLTCPYCSTVLRGPAEMLLGKACPSCTRTLPPM